MVSSGWQAAMLGCAVSLFLHLLGCSANPPKEAYRAIYRGALSESELAVVDLGAAHKVIIDDQYFVSREKYGTVELPAGAHRIAWMTECASSVMVEPQGFAAYGVVSDVALEAGHAYRLSADRTHGTGYRIYHWIEDTTTGRVVFGEKKP